MKTYLIKSKSFPEGTPSFWHVVVIEDVYLEKIKETYHVKEYVVAPVTPITPE